MPFLLTLNHNIIKIPMCNGRMLKKPIDYRLNAYNQSVLF